MDRLENEQFVRNFFEAARKRNTRLVAEFIDDGASVVDQAARIFDEMIPDMAYVDNHKGAMADSVFQCNVMLAIYLALKERGIDVHEFGKMMLTKMEQAPIKPPEEQPESAKGRSMQEQLAAFISAGEASQKEAAPGEFVFEAFLGDGEDYDWGMNVKSCAICHAFSKYDAMDLVPYMCATDDVMSDKGKQGLRRSGSIAVGAHQCDFRYKRGGEPDHLSRQYPHKIQVAQKA